MYTFILIRADEGSTQEICVAHGETLEVLAGVVTAEWAVTIAACAGPVQAENQRYYTKERDALLAMLAAHTPCEPGRYVLPSIDPIWEQCTLVIAAADGCFLP